MKIRLKHEGSFGETIEFDIDELRDGDAITDSKGWTWYYHEVSP
jgi:hypothetical protein